MERGSAGALPRPKMLADYLEATGQSTSEHEPLSDSHLLEEAEWCLYNACENEASAACEYHPSSKRALKRYVEKLRLSGVEPKHDFEL